MCPLSSLMAPHKPEAAEPLSAGTSLTVPTKGQEAGGQAKELQCGTEHPNLDLWLCSLHEGLV